MVTTFHTCRALHAALPVLGIISLTGCDVGYNVDTSNDKVVWVTWDEGNGRREWPVNGADSKTFEVMKLQKLNGGKQFGKDKNHVYLADARIDAADPKTFREFGTGYRDDNSVFVWVDSAIKELAGSDPDSFKRLDQQFWSRDANRVFFQNRGFVPRDIASFELLDGFWARDRFAHYYQHRELPDAHWDTFKVDVKWKTFARDRDHVFWEGRLIVGADPQSFVTTKHYEGHDRKTNFYCFFEDEKLQVLKKPFVNPDGEKQP